MARNDESTLGMSIWINLGKDSLEDCDGDEIASILRDLADRLAGRDGFTTYEAAGRWELFGTDGRPAGEATIVD